MFSKWAILDMYLPLYGKMLVCISDMLIQLTYMCICVFVYLNFNNIPYNNLLCKWYIWFRYHTLFKERINFTGFGHLSSMLNLSYWWPFIPETIPTNQMKFSKTIPYISSNILTRRYLEYLAVIYILWFLLQTTQ